MATRLRNEKYLSIGDVCARYGVSRMTVYRWAKNDRDFPDAVTINRRKYFREYDIGKWEAARGGADPDLESRIVGLSPVSGVITEYEQLVAALVSRRQQMGISSIELDARSGMQEGYASKLENYGRPQGRGMGPEMFPLWLGGLKVGIVLVDLPRRQRRAK